MDSPLAYIATAKKTVVIEASVSRKDGGVAFSYYSSQRDTLATPKNSCRIALMDENSKNQKDQPGIDDLISLSQAADYSEFSTSHLRLLVSRGEMWGVKLGRNWFTTIQAIETYIRQGRKPGPKPEKKS